MSGTFADANKRQRSDVQNDIKSLLRIPVHDNYYQQELDHEIRTNVCEYFLLLKAATQDMYHFRK